MSGKGWVTVAAAVVAVLAVAAATLPSLRPSWAPLEVRGEDPPPPGTATVVTVRSVADGRPIDPRLYSFNLAPWPSPPDHNPPDPTFVAMVRQLNPALLRFPAGHWSQSACWDLPGAPPCSAGTRHRFDAAELEGFLETARQVGAEPLIAVNIKTGTPEQAAALVRYLNVDRGHDVTWFELGNEPDLPGDPPTSPEQEAQKFLRFSHAMRKVDPDIRLVGGVFMTGAHVAPWGMRTDWMGPFSHGVGSSADAYAWHWYPLDSDNRNPASGAHPSVDHLMQESSWNWPPSGLSFAEKACARMEQVRAATGAEHWVTELGPDSGALQAPNITDGQVAAVWLADALPRLAACGADAVFQFTLRQAASSHLVLMRHDRTPTPMWGAYQLLSAHYRGEIVPALPNRVDPQLAAHAVRAPDGALVVVLVNKGPSLRTLSLQWEGARPDAAQTWLLEAESPTSPTAQVNGVPLDRDLVLSGFPPTDTNPWGTVELPPYSVRVVRAW